MTQGRNQTCPVALALDDLGDKWTLLIVREAMKGVTRFNDFCKNTGIARNLLSDRLRRMIEANILETNDIAANGIRHEYRLTSKGRGLNQILLALGHWANCWVDERGNRSVPLASLKNTRTATPVFQNNIESGSISWRETVSTASSEANFVLRDRTRIGGN